MWTAHTFGFLLLWKGLTLWLLSASFRCTIKEVTYCTSSRNPVELNKPNDDSKTPEVFPITCVRWDWDYGVDGTSSAHQTKVLNEMASNENSPAREGGPVPMPVATQAVQTFHVPFFLVLLQVAVIPLSQFSVWLTLIVLPEQHSWYPTVLI